MALSVKYDKRGLQSVKKRVKDLGSLEILTGFFEEDRYGPENNNMAVAEVAWIQERGAGMQIPSRPFMSHTFTQRALVATYAKLMSEITTQALTLGRGQSRLEGELADTVAASMKDTIRDWTSPPNSEWWARQKGKNDPLVFTGHMLASVKSKIRRK